MTEEKREPSPGLAEVLADGLGAPDRVILDDPPAPVYDRAEPQDTAEWALWAHAANRDQTRTRAGRVGAVRQAVTTAVRGCILRLPELTEAEIREAVEAELAARMTQTERDANEAAARAWLAESHDEDRCHAHGEGVQCCFDILDELVFGVQLAVQEPGRQA